MIDRRTMVVHFFSVMLASLRDKLFEIFSFEGGKNFNMNQTNSGWIIIGAIKLLLLLCSGKCIKSINLFVNIHTFAVSCICTMYMSYLLYFILGHKNDTKAKYCLCKKLFISILENWYDWNVLKMKAWLFGLLDIAIGQWPKTAERRWIVKKTCIEKTTNVC